MTFKALVSACEFRPHGFHLVQRVEHTTELRIRRGYFQQRRSRYEADVNIVIEEKDCERFLFIFYVVFIFWLRGICAFRLSKIKMIAVIAIK